MSELKIDLLDMSATNRLAAALAKVTDRSVIVALNGPLGVGKTKFVQCFARALGVEEVVNSPTFTMLNEYHSGRIPLYHLDLYRLGETDTFAAVQYLEEELSEILSYPHAILIEWAELLDKQSATENLSGASDARAQSDAASKRITDPNFLLRLDHLVTTFSYEDSSYGSSSEDSCEPVYDEVQNENQITFSSSLYKHQERRRVSIQAAGSNSERLLLLLPGAMSAESDK